MALETLAMLLFPEAVSAFFVSLFDIHLRASLVMLVGSLGLAVSLLFLLGLAKTYTYGLLSMISLGVFLGAVSYILNSQTDYHTILPIVPVVFSSLALFIMRHLDTKWILGKKKSLFS